MSDDTEESPTPTPLPATIQDFLNGCTGEDHLEGEVNDAPDYEYDEG